MTAFNPIAPIGFSATAKTITVRGVVTGSRRTGATEGGERRRSGQSVETEATVTTASGWQTLSFNFASQAGGTAALTWAWTRTSSVRPATRTSTCSSWAAPTTATAAAAIARSKGTITPTTNNMITYTLPLAGMALVQPCNGGSFSSGVSTVAQALAQPIGAVNTQFTFPNVNTTINSGTVAAPVYATGLTRGKTEFR